VHELCVQGSVAAQDKLLLPALPQDKAHRTYREGQVSGLQRRASGPPLRHPRHVLKTLILAISHKNSRGTHRTCIKSHTYRSLLLALQARVSER